jgi:hypothetical protein
MQHREIAITIAAAAGAAGGALSALSIAPGDGVVRLATVARIVLVLLAFSLAALSLRDQRGVLGVWLVGAVAAANAAALAVAFGLVGATAALRPIEAAGYPCALAGMIQVGSLVVAAVSARGAAVRQAGR